MRDSSSALTVNRPFYRVIALILSLSLLLGLTSCNKRSAPSTNEARAAVEDEYGMSFTLENREISEDGSVAMWVFVSDDNTLRVTVTWIEGTSDKFTFEEERISNGKPARPSETYATEPTERETSETGPSRAEPRQRDGMIKVGIINNDYNESGYRTANDKDMKATFNKDNGYDAGFFYSNGGDAQVEAARKFINDGVDYLLISAANSSGWDSVLKDAKTAGVKVILFDRTIDADESLYEASVISDMTLEGQKAVNWLSSQGLSECKIIHLQGIKGSAAQQGRTVPLEIEVKLHPNWKIVKQESAEWGADRAKDIVQSVIKSGEKFNVIYAENDDMAKGAVEALDKAKITHGVGGEVIIISFDCNKWALEEVLAGRWNCDMQCSPFQASYIDNIIKNGTTRKTVIIDDKLFEAGRITQEDVDKYGL